MFDLNRLGVSFENKITLFILRADYVVVRKSGGGCEYFAAEVRKTMRQSLVIGIRLLHVVLSNLTLLILYHQLNRSIENKTVNISNNKRNKW